MKSTTPATQREPSYEIRGFQAGDDERFLDLHGTVWGRRRHADWFDWRFRDNPAADGVRIVFAERDGELVGAEPVLPYRLSIGGETVTALQPVDWIVHPDHRGEGLATRMTEARIDRDGDAALYFNFPSPPLRPLLTKLGWRTVGRTTTYYRVQDPPAVARRRGGGRRARIAATLATPLARGYLGTRDWLADAPTDVAVERIDGVPTVTLADLYRRSVPDRIHVVRDESFLDWRFANPDWTVRTYLARRDGRLVGSLVTCTESGSGARTTLLADALPLAGGSRAAFAALVGAAVADAPRAAVLTATANPIPPAVLAHHGFVADDRFPLSRFGTDTTHVARPLPEPDGNWQLGGVELDAAENWQLSLSDQDVA
ncbi:GNAT family N-acetyltransferase [Halorientalis halophila]|uniref:GNAT family N-acetyltransferase n=1 Tax=Halorientalis halophila TaxID=3108499 RepID=UPI0030092FFB